jgi:hypothetical protein
MPEREYVQTPSCQAAGRGRNAPPGQACSGSSGPGSPCSAMSSAAYGSESSWCRCPGARAEERPHHGRVPAELPWTTVCPTPSAVSAACGRRAPSAGLIRTEGVRTEVGSGKQEPMRTETVSMPCRSQ